jgi:hypothetical protein
MKSKCPIKYLSLLAILNYAPTAFAAGPANIVFILADDLGEQRNLAAQNLRKTAEPKKLLHVWRTQVATQMPTPNPNYQPSAQTRP